MELRRTITIAAGDFTCTLIELVEADAFEALASIQMG